MHEPLKLVLPLLELRWGIQKIDIVLENLIIPPKKTHNLE